MVDAPIYMLQSPAFVVNEAVDLLGQSGKIIGDLTDGTPVAEAARRFYGQGLRMLLRTAHWSFARRMTRLNLLGDNTGSAEPPVIPYVERPWAYAYEWPIDAVQGRWMPWSPANVQPQTSSGLPLTTGQSSPLGYALVPGRFLVSSSDQYPVVIGEQDWTQRPDLQRTSGVGPSNRKIILTDCCAAHFVYTRFVPVIEEWDSLFRQAFVKMLALVILPTAVDDPKSAEAMRVRLMAELKIAVDDARVANGNESTTSATTDFEASFIRARNGGSWGGVDRFGSSIGGIGYDSCSWESMSFGGQVY